MDEIARDIIKAFYGDDIGKVKLNKVVWFDLLSKGSNTDFYALYDINQTPFLDVFTTRSGQPENLYHEVYQGYGIDAFYATISNKTFFVSTNRGGSGGFLSASIYDYDGIGKLRLVHQIDGMFQGWLFVVDNRIFLSGNTQKYELKYDGKTFSLEKYQQRLSCNQNGSHVLAYHLMDGKFFITYAGKEITFKDTPPPDTDPVESAKTKVSWKESIAPILIGLNELIILDDNMEEPGEIRLIMHEKDNLAPRGGLFSSLLAKEVGTIHMSISYNYETWYEIEVVIKK